MNDLETQIRTAYTTIADVTEVRSTKITESTYRVNVYSKYRPDGGAWDVSYMVGSHFCSLRDNAWCFDPPLGHHYTVKG